LLALQLIIIINYYLLLVLLLLLPTCQPHWQSRYHILQHVSVCPTVRVCLCKNWKTTAQRLV